MDHAEFFFNKAKEAIDKIDLKKINIFAGELAKVREKKGRIFLLGSVVVQEIVLMPLMISESFVKLNVIRLVIILRS